MTVTDNGHAPTDVISIADRIRLEEITVQAHEANPGNFARSLLLAPFFLIGWVCGKGSRAFALAVAYLGVSVRTGWRVARKEPLSQPRIEDVMAENLRLRAEVQRMSG